MRRPKDLQPQETNLATMKSCRESESTCIADQAKDQKTKTKHLKSLKIATYNVRSLRGSGKEYQLTTGCEKFKINIIAIQEHRHKLDEEIKMSWNNEKTWLKAYTSANEDGNGGIGLLFDKKTASSLKQVEKITERIMIAHIDGNPQITLIACYAPTNLADELAKENFYIELKKVMANIPPHNVAIVLGDFNARIGKNENQFNPIVIGRYSLHEESNENGERLVELCESYKLRPVSTKFPHRPGRIWTWEHPNGARAQLDHILIRGKWINSIKNCRAYNTINIDSDHRIVCADFRLSLRTQKLDKNKRVKYNWDLLDNNIKRNEFDIELRNRFEALNGFQGESEVDYDVVIKAVEEESQNVLGVKKKTKHPNWVSNNTQELEQQCIQAKKKYQNKRSAASHHQWRSLEDALRKSFSYD